MITVPYSNGWIGQSPPCYLHEGRGGRSRPLGWAVDPKAKHQVIHGYGMWRNSVMLCWATHYDDIQF